MSYTSRASSIMVGIMLCVTLAGCTESVFEKEYAKFRAIRKGMSEAQVVEQLGPPYKVYYAADAPDDYYVKGYSREERSITNKVFIYLEAEPIAYVYFDHSNTVEHVFVGGS